MNARAIIEEAIDPKRILRQMNLTPPTPPKVLDWAKANFHPDQMATYRFYHAIAPLSQEFMLRGIIWLNVYLTSVWYRLVLQYGPSPGSPVFAKWDLNPGFYAHDPASEAQVVRPGCAPQECAWLSCRRAAG